MHNADIMQCARALGYQNHSSVRNALLKDDEDIRNLLHAVMASEADRVAVVALRGDSADKFLNLTYNVRATSRFPHAC